MTETLLSATREAWLLAAIDAVRPLFTTAGHPLPERIRVSVGFGYATRGESRYILAQAWAARTAADQVPSVFVSPRLGTADDALAALLHELVHVADDCAHGHGKEFAEIGAAIGLEGKPTQMIPGVALTATVITITETLGGYPHAALDITPTTPTTTPDPSTNGDPGNHAQPPAGADRAGPADQPARQGHLHHPRLHRPDRPHHPALAHHRRRPAVPDLHPAPDPRTLTCAWPGSVPPSRSRPGHGVYTR